MTLDNPARRRGARRAAVVGATLSAIMMSLSGWALLSPGVADAAATDAGAAQIVTPAGGVGAGQPLSSGGSATSFNLKLPAGAACMSDGNNGGRWHTYMVPGAENPATVAFAGNGALTGASVGSDGTGAFRNSLYSTTSTPVRGQAPNLGDAAVINIPNMRFSVWSAGNIPPGVYNLGIACVDLDLASARDSYWNTQLTVEADATDPIGIRWVVEEPSTTTTTGSTTSSTGSTSSTTSTTDGTSSSTTSTTDGTTSSTTDDFTTSTDPSSAVLGASVDDTTTGGTGSALPATGRSVLRLIASALLLLVLGRTVVLLGRPTPVLGPDQ
jgi:hypothetical protein